MNMEAAIKELQEAAIVMAGIQSRHVEMLQDHAEWLHSHDRAMIRHDKEMAEARERGKATDERIDKMQAEMRERGRIIDERIEKLAGAIGKMTGHRN